MTFVAFAIGATTLHGLTALVRTAQHRAGVFGTLSWLTRGTSYGKEPSPQHSLSASGGGRRENEMATDPPTLWGVREDWTRFDCGCQYRHQSSGIGDMINFVYCPQHSAAPELLEALHRYVESDGYEDEIKEQARAAIEKAKGDS